MTNKEKKEYAILTILLIAIFFVVYFTFFRSNSTEQTPLDVTNNTVQYDESGNPIPGTGATATQQSAFLPHGTSLDSQIIQDPRFRALIPPSYPQLNIAEIGVANPFGQ